ncbi:MAG: GNAT family N-acetyltransferase, partial [Methylococcaceae bacterium]
DGNFEYEERYLQTYLKEPDSLVVLVYDGDTAVGATTGIPMQAETPEFQKPFIEHGYDPERIFYCAESVLLPAYRGRGIYTRFFEAREGHALSLGRFDVCCFCCVQRPTDHPLRPARYVPLDSIWTKFGYTRHEQLSTSYAWKDLDESSESDKPMVFWLKNLEQPTS